MTIRPISSTALLTLLCGLLMSCTTPEPTAPPEAHIERVTIVPDGLRPPILGPNAGIAAGHPLTTAAALEVLHNGGNAFDAGVAALLVGGVVEQDLYSLGGEALVLVYPQAEGRVTSIVGQGWAAQAATIDWYRARGKTLNGAGLDPAVIPGAIHGALTVLERWGTMSFETVSARAIEYAENGFALIPRTAQALQREYDFIQQWPDNQRFWLKPNGLPYAAGEVIKMPTLAYTLQRMVESERAAASQGREAGVVAARDQFYKGDIAKEMIAFLEPHSTPFVMADFTEFYARVEEPSSTNYRGYTVYKQSFNSQGPSLLQMLNILENFDLQAMGHNSADYIHTIVEAMKLAFADRDTYYADPDFVDIPAAGLLSKDYAAERAQLIDMERASTTHIAGDPLAFDDTINDWQYWIADLEAPYGDQLLAGLDYPSAWKDTTHIAIIDKDGNVFDSTPSGGWIGGSVILGDTGIPMSVRGEQFWLDDTKAAQLRPRSRPRYSLTPSIVLRDGEPFLAIGTPGGDNQEQTILQTFLNIVEFEDAWYPNMHDAIAMPRVQTLHFYESFWPHDTGFNRLNAESTVPISILRDLASRGHQVYQAPPLGLAACASIVMLDPNTQTRIAGADPRRDCYAAAY